MKFLIFGRILSWVISLIIGFALADYFLPNLPFFVHWFVIAFIASTNRFLYFATSYFANETLKTELAKLGKTEAVLPLAWSKTWTKK